MRCDECGEEPCLTPTFCAGARERNAWWAKIPPDHPLREGPMGNLPKGWRHMGEAELWHRLQRAHEKRRTREDNNG